MSRLAQHAEHIKLCHLLGVSPDDYAFLRRLPVDELKVLRGAVFELHDRQRPFYRRLVATVARRLPPWLAAILCGWLLGPRLVAQVATDLPARQVARIVQRLPTAYIAASCPYLDPRYAHDLIRLLPQTLIVDIALEMLNRRDYLTLGRFVDYISDEAIAAVLDVIRDDEHILHIGLFVESPARLDHIVRLMPRERLIRAMLLVLDPQRDVLTEVMSIIVHVSYGLQRELGDLAAEQDEEVLAKVIHEAQAQDFWADILPVLANVSEGSLRKVANLPLLQQEPDVLASIINTADAEDLWGSVLPLVPLLDEGLKELVAKLASPMPRAALERAANAALVGEHWPELVEMVERMPAAKQAEFALILQHYGEVDSELCERVMRLARGHGMAWCFPALPAIVA